MELGLRDRARFLKRVSVQSDDGCHLWTGSKRKDGYGSFMVGSRCVAAHRLAWEMKNGPISGDLFVCHRCDNPACVNPDHLFLGTHAENMKDMYEKGRGRQARGEAHWQAKLTEADVIQIKKSDRPNRELAEHYGVGRNAIDSVRKGINWKWVS